ncbi:MAG TPA: cupin domain-containing protein [Hyalangium sp.]|nr:cupin domain-containing protein [Hyalangium sp.]
MTCSRMILSLSGAAVLGISALSWASKPTTAPRYVVSTKEAPRYLLPNGQGSATLMLNASTGASAASMGLLELSKGAKAPEHTHDTSAELLYVEDGAVEMIVDGQKMQAGKGDAIYIPAGAKHSVVVVSDSPFRAVQVYVGPGPEQRFTQGTRADKKDSN